MLEFMISRIGKPALMMLITFFSVRYITGSAVDGVIVGLLPAVLGATNVFASTGYSLTAFALIAAVLWAVMPGFAKTPLISFVTETWHAVIPAPKPAATPAVSNAPPPVTVTTTTKTSGASTSTKSH